MYNSQNDLGQRSGQFGDEKQLRTFLRIEVLFEFNTCNPKLTFYRAIRSTDGYFRMAKRGKNAKKFKSAMCCGSLEGLLKFKEAVEFYRGK